MAICFLLKKKYIDGKYIDKNFYDSLNADKDKLENVVNEKEQEIINLNKDNAKNEEAVKNLNEKLKDQKDETKDLYNKFKIEFENISNRLLQAKSKEFVEINKNSINILLDPLKEKIKEFKKQVSDVYQEEVRERITLKHEIKSLLDFNKQFNESAIRLTNALKGDSKVQGDWGELQLERILQSAGLLKDIHYQSQEVFETEDGSKQRPDYIINLPDEKSVILDSKVSLTAYERYFSEQDKDKKEQYLKEHVLSLEKHIKDLSSKSYQKIYQINQLDYVFMFIPLEGAYYTALEADRTIFEKALDKNIALVTASTLFVTLRTIACVWKQEDQKKNVFEIAKESGALYEKFVGFIGDLDNVGRKLDDAKESFDLSMNKLTESKKKGDTIVGRIERIKKLGANTSKSLPDELLMKIKE